MTSERFLATQAEIEQAPAALWERWTIDEIDEEFARVLIARAAVTARIRAIAGSVVGDLSSPGQRHRIADLLKAAAMSAELEPSTEQWSEESYGYARLEALQKFLRARGGKPGLPSERALREGDVFWAVATDAAPFRPLADMTPAELETHIAVLRKGRADVWDVTAAARQAAKRSYHEVVRRANEDEQLHAEAEHG